ncbi:MAG: hypothetical protein EBV03_03470 [Proteobacteria bacterium]|nr:hypothetical protein [Pseudomonadota bacterium]
MEYWLNYAAIYVVASWLALHLLRGQRLRETVFCGLGLAATYACFFNEDGALPLLSAYVGFVLMHYLLLDYAHANPENRVAMVLSIASPLLALLLAKLIQPGRLAGFSYLTFRLAYTAYELYIGRIAMPQPLRYLGYAFFPLTFLIGPISPFANYDSSLQRAGAAFAPYSRCLGRILVGILKCYILAMLFKTLTFPNYWSSNYHHNFTDFTLSCISTALYIYFNFSGATDIMIGAAGLIGIRVAENFNNPFLSRNLAEFWTRNHITLAQVARDLAYTPLTLWLLRQTRGRYAGAINAGATILTFFIIGIWHGNEIGFACFGLMHGIGVAAVNIYGGLWRQFPQGLRAFTQTTPMRVLSTCLTFMYVSYSTVFFGSDLNRLQTIWFQLY